MEGAVEGEAFSSFIGYSKLSRLNVFLRKKKNNKQQGVKCLLAQDVKANCSKKCKTNHFIVKFTRQAVTLLILLSDSLS